MSKETNSISNVKNTELPTPTSLSKTEQGDQKNKKNSTDSLLELVSQKLECEK